MNAPNHNLLVGSLTALALLLGDRLGAGGKELTDQATELLEHYCFDCHDAATKKGEFNLEGALAKEHFDGSLMFENLLTGKMPPANKKQPDREEKQALLEWLVRKQEVAVPNSFRRVSRHEFVHSVNDLLGTNLDLADRIPEDRGTKDFDSDRRIQLSREMLSSYFSVADEMLEHAFPTRGGPSEGKWVTSKVKDSHQTYEIYLRPYEEGILFSWTRANNGNSYSFFYDNFDPPVPGWYDLTFDAAKVGEFDEDVSVLVFGGKYYFADDRPQPQRLLEVISLGNRELKSHTIRAFLRPGENVSVHCQVKHNFRQKNVVEGAYIKQLTARGPVFDQWPPTSYQSAFEGLPVNAAKREPIQNSGFQTKLDRIGGNLTVSSFQEGMEKERMQDGSNRTFWHTRFKPTVAKPPHYVIVENPRGAEIEGLSFATWSGGNGNGLVKAFEIYFSDDGESWGARVMEGGLETKRTFEQPIVFPQRTRSRFIKFLVTDAVSLDGKSIASIGKLDVLTALAAQVETARISVDAKTPKDLKRVVRRFAQRAFSSEITEEELRSYLRVGLTRLEEEGDFVEAAKVAFKAIMCSHRFLLAPGEHANPSYARAAELARMLWLSIPDDELLALAKSDQLKGAVLREQIARMIADPRSRRMIRSFSDQWLNLRSFNKVTPSLKLYPLYDDLLNHYLPIETRSYLHHLVQENLSAGHLIDANFSFLNQRLAQHYGIDGVFGQELRRVSFPPASPRGGLLTMGSVLKVTTDGFETSPILRGAWISKNIVGTPLSPPPESVPALEPEHGHAATLKEQIAQHKTNKTCYACHKSIDPYGFALENFDAVGEWRERYKIKQPHRSTFQYRPGGYFKLGGSVDASGEIDERAFKDIFGLKKVLLANERKIAYSFAKKFFEYANGYQPTLQERLHLWNFLGRNPENGRLQDLITEVILNSMSKANK